MKPIACLFMKQNCHFDRGLAQHKHATPPLSYQPSKFKRVDFLSFYLIKRTFRLHFYWQLLSPLRYIPFWKPRSMVIMPEKLKGGVACLCCARPLSKLQFCFINRQAIGFIRSLLYIWARYISAGRYIWARYISDRRYFWVRALLGQKVLLGQGQFG